METNNANFPKGKREENERTNSCRIFLQGHGQRGPLHVARLTLTTPGSLYTCGQVPASNDAYYQVFLSTLHACLG